jgi:hypothetical protein
MYFADIGATSGLEWGDWTYRVGTIKYGRSSASREVKIMTHSRESTNIAMAADSQGVIEIPSV